MLLAFSTLGCPEWSMDQVIANAVALGYSGVEFRGLLSEIDLEKVPEFTPARIADTRRRLQREGLEAVCLSSSVQIVAASATDIDLRRAVAMVKYYIEMARELEAPYVRIFGGEIPDGMLRDDAFRRAVEALQYLGNFADAREVTVLVETHDHFVNSQALSELLRSADQPSIRALWDIHHPYRSAGESISQTMRNLRGQIY